MDAGGMYIAETTSPGGEPAAAPLKYASASSIPSILGDASPPLEARPGRRHSVLEDLKARRDSLFQRARRAQDEKENAKDAPEKERRRGSVFYVSDDLLEENGESAVLEATKKGRRKSWHPLAKPPKLDRKRRKGVAGVAAVPPGPLAGSTEGLYSAARQKRPSWWNVFVPDSVGRSKSRSVDHGFSAPFDLDPIRSKVEGRFESVDKLSKDSDSESKDGSTTQEKKHGRVSQPIDTIAYTVGDRDTLPSVAARFDTTPSELTKLNRLGSTFIYPGQKLWVPARGEGRPGGAVEIDAPSPDPCHDHESQDDLPPEEKELLDNLRPVSPKPGHMERIKTPLGTTNTNMDDDEQPYRERFLKIDVRHITDGQGVVEGVLLVTPNAVMFDPYVSDPLVIEHGAESYGVIAPMEFVVNAVIYYDIAHMRVSHTESNNPEKKPDIYYMKKPSQADGHKCQSPGKDENFSELAGDDSESVCSCAERDGAAFPKAFERDLVTPTNLQNDEGSALTKDKDKDKDNASKECGGGQASKTLEERKRSLLDHHWAVPSKDRCSFSVDDEQQDSLNSDKAEPVKPNAIPEDEEGSLVKLSCHDSGIDIRDPNPPLPVVQPIPSKKVYSDADIVLSSDWVPPITIAPTNVTSNSLDSGSAINGRKKASSVSFSLESNAEEQEKDEDHKDDDKQETRKNKMIKRLSYPLSWMEGLTGEKEDGKTALEKVSSLPNSADAHHSSVFSKVFSRRSSVGTFIRQQPLTSSGSSSVDSSRGSKTSTAPKLDYRSMVSADDMPDLFASIDKLIPRPARSCEHPPLYLRLRTGRPKDKKIPKSTPIMSYGKKKLQPEYWFSVPRDRVDDLYRFIQAWVPALYGEFDENLWRERGYIFSDSESPDMSPHDGEPSELAEEGKTGLRDGDDISQLTRGSWELIKAPYVKLYSILTTTSISGDSEQPQDPEVPLSSLLTGTQIIR
ncbi:oxidation resistance protein 1 isoform X2 [Orussus abietinus]|uniref:oxidation resistance protein 1 isoform X2 n=1 Tax=Orussus abietinus TaxID=222816 RepID=UPI000C715DA2|nr:oxidation resistance protein 1 isoform X2 [Orussus abietinus]